MPFTNESKTISGHGLEIFLTDTIKSSDWQKNSNFKRYLVMENLIALEFLADRWSVQGPHEDQ